MQSDIGLSDLFKAFVSIDSSHRHEIISFPSHARNMFCSTIIYEYHGVPFIGWQEEVVVRIEQTKRQLLQSCSSDRNGPQVMNVQCSLDHSIAML